MANFDFESVNEHMNRVDLDAFDKGGKHHSAVSNAASNPSAAVEGICDAYQEIRPFLILISDIVLLPKKWRDVIKKFISVADLLCPST